MNRRSLFAAALGAVVALVIPSPANATPSLRAVYRYSYATDTWTRCRLFEVRAGDVFRYDNEPSMLAYGDPVKQPDGVWAIQVSFRIDPATNQWVPIAG